jgi:hypothetical protein
MRRQKSLRIGVHHANGVVWRPVYRTRLRRTPPFPSRFTRDRRLCVAALAAAGPIVAAVRGSSADSASRSGARSDAQTRSVTSEGVV